jgi:uncharacterized DUF497 family protein
MNFEYDPEKSRINREKHGIDFEEAQRLWEDERMLEAPLPFSDEARWICIGKIGEKVWSAIVTRRNGAIRIISVRRSRKKEREHYENG